MDRFEFGENWRNYSEQFQAEDYFRAKDSLKELVPDIKDKTFLDVGCGSGLFSTAASALGAKSVYGFDYDPKSVATSKAVLEKASSWDNDIKKNIVSFEQGSILDENIKSLGKHDIVYSWGVLHHTGDMYKAFDMVSSLVNKNGLLVIAIYNKFFTSPLWKAVKYTYVKSPSIIKKFIIGLALIRYAVVSLILTGKLPFHRVRGMRFYTDVVDWIGGYPYEYASVKEVTNFFEKKGFKLKTLIKARGGTGCNQFVFNKIG